MYEFNKLKPETLQVPRGIAGRTSNLRDEFEQEEMYFIPTNKLRKI